MHLSISVDYTIVRRNKLVYVVSSIAVPRVKLGNLLYYILIGLVDALIRVGLTGTNRQVLTGKTYNSCMI